MIDHPIEGLAARGGIVTLHESLTEAVGHFRRVALDYRYSRGSGAHPMDKKVRRNLMARYDEMARLIEDHALRTQPPGLEEEKTL